MENSKRIAGLIGSSLIAITIPEALNVHIWAANIAPAIHFNGALLFVAGLSIVRAHNHWIRGWPVIVTLVGWLVSDVRSGALSTERSKYLRHDADRIDNDRLCNRHLFDLQSLWPG